MYHRVSRNANGISVLILIFNCTKMEGMEKETAAGINGKYDIPIAGVIGGVGPYAGLDFVSKIFANTLATRDQDHLNCMLISCSSIIPDRTEFLLQNKREEENPAYGMFECARRLYLAGVRFVVVACNTAHANRIFGSFCKMVKDSLPGLNIINMLETCAGFVKKNPEIAKLGYLATKGTFKSGVYHEYFRKEDGFDLIEPDVLGQEEIHQAIYNEDFGLKAYSQPAKTEAVDRLNREIYKLIDRGAKAVILGCTELSLGVQKSTYPVPIIDPALIAARRLIEITAPDKLIPL